MLPSRLGCRLESTSRFKLAHDVLALGSTQPGHAPRPTLIAAATGRVLMSQIPRPPASHSVSVRLQESRLASQLVPGASHGRPSCLAAQAHTEGPRSRRAK